MHIFILAFFKKNASSSIPMPSVHSGAVFLRVTALFFIRNIIKSLAFLNLHTSKNLAANDYMLELPACRQCKHVSVQGVSK